APDYDVREEIALKPRKTISRQTLRNREKARRMNPGLVFFFSLIIMVFGVALFGELSLQAGNVRLRREIASMKSELNNIRMDNDEEESRIMGSVDMQEIKEKAITKLGMQYAQSGQVVEVADATDDYVHQYQELP
ncbi:MAG: cell division protein FtsL, partial [Lachnospiraceae bacterium]|nr:cell division protein FtsL [Lachnospiraceae bacterium]